MQIWRRTCVTSCPAGLNSKINLNLKNDISAFSFHEYIWSIFTYHEHFFWRTSESHRLQDHPTWKKSKFRQQLTDLYNFRVRTLLEIKIRSRAKNNLGKTFKKGGIFGKHCLSFRFLQNRFPKALTWYFETSEPMLPTQATSAKWCTKTMGQSDPDKSKGCHGLTKRTYCGFAQIVRLHLDANKAP